MTASNSGNQNSTQSSPLNNNSSRNPQQGIQHENENREHHLDQTIADSFPASDPPSTDPNPGGDD